MPSALPGFLGLWVSGSLGLRVYGSTGLRVYGFLDFCVSGFPACLSLSCGAGRGPRNGCPAPAPAQRRRSGLRPDFAALLVPWVRGRTRCAPAALRSDSARESVHEARCARPPGLRCSPPPDGPAQAPGSRSSCEANWRGDTNTRMGVAANAEVTKLSRAADRLDALRWQVSSVSLERLAKAAVAALLPSASRRIATICSSVNRPFLMFSSQVEEPILRNYWYEETGQVRRD